jgi:hypothetical protein
MGTPIVLKDAFIEIDSNDVSEYANKVELDIEYEDLDATTEGQNAHVRRNGLQDGTVAVTFLNDFTAGALDEIMWGLAGGDPVPYVIRPKKATVIGTSNPEYRGNLLINSWKPISGDVGKLATSDVTYPTSGLNTRATV